MRRSSRRSHRSWLLLLLLGTIAACTEEIPGGRCAQDSDCSNGETCLYDANLETSYCTSFCTTSEDCPAHQTCAMGKLSGLSGAEEKSICVDRVRACLQKEFCNGLDDDCDGVIDNQGCELIRNCADDSVCGAFVCLAPVGQSQTLCGPPSDTATKKNFEGCTSDAECISDRCVGGFCSPLCPGAREGTCPLIRLGGVARQTLCAQALYGDRPLHNVCQFHCPRGETECPQGTSCTWRQVIGGGSQHFLTCSSLDPARKPLGAECTDNNPNGGDSECQHGLCYDRICTRQCGGNAQCTQSIGGNSTCETETLFYETQEFELKLCTKP